jgi:hypothetical protein
MTIASPNAALANRRIEGISVEENPDTLTHPTLAFLRRYWEEKRGTRPMPSRAEFLPRDLKEHLGWIVLVDVTEDLSEFRYRLVGTRVTQYLLRECTGKSLVEAFKPFGEAATKANLAIYRKVARDRLVMRCFGGAGWLGRGYLDFDALFLPLSDDGERVNIILCAFTFDTVKLVKVRGDLKATDQLAKS